MRPSPSTCGGGLGGTQYNVTFLDPQHMAHMRDNGYGECATDSCIPFSNSVSSDDRPAAFGVSYHLGETNIGGITVEADGTFPRQVMPQYGRSS